MLTGVGEADADLVSGALAGSERAFQQLVRRYERPIFSVILRIIRDPSRAEELAQDTFVKAFRGLHTYRPERKFSAWLLSIAHHVAIDEVRRGRIQTEQLEETSRQYGSSSCDDETPYGATERSELATIVNDAIRRLRPEYAELITLKYEQDLTIEEMVEVTALPIGTIKSSLHRARKDLADSLRRRGLSTIR